MRWRFAIDRSFRAVLAANVRSYGLTLVGLTPIAWLMALAYLFVGPLVAFVFALPLYTTRAAYKAVVDIRIMFTQTVRALASAIDARDPSTKKHSEHVSGIAVEIGQAMNLSEAELEQLEWAGLLHDIGKIGIRDAVLLKPDRLTREERMLMNEHPAKGEEILKDVDQLARERPLIRHHHEWFNGSGLPRPTHRRGDPAAGARPPCGRCLRGHDRLTPVPPHPAQPSRGARRSCSATPASSSTRRSSRPSAARRPPMRHTSGTDDEPASPSDRSCRFPPSARSRRPVPAARCRPALPRPSPRP